jgi:predicted ferric reductase
VNGKLLWYVARSSGLVTWALVAASVLWGLALSTRALGRRPRPAWLLDLHRFLGGAAVVFTAIHVITVVLDSYVHFGLVNVLVPFTGSWHPVAVAWGIVSLYLLVAVEATSLLRTRLPKRVWRATHYLSFPLFAMATIHGMTAGTDRHSPLMVWSVVGMTAAIAGFTAYRAAGVERRSPPSSAGRAEAIATARAAAAARSRIAHPAAPRDGAPPAPAARPRVRVEVGR